MGDRLQVRWDGGELVALQQVWIGRDIAPDADGHLVRVGARDDLVPRVAARLTQLPGGPWAVQNTATQAPLSIVGEGGTATLGAGQTNLLSPGRSTLLIDGHFGPYSVQLDLTTAEAADEPPPRGAGGQTFLPPAPDPGLTLWLCARFASFIVPEGQRPAPLGKHEVFERYRRAFPPTATVDQLAKREEKYRERLAAAMNQAGFDGVGITGRANTHRFAELLVQYRWITPAQLKDLERLASRPPRSPSPD